MHICRGKGHVVERHIGSVHIRYVREVVEVFLCFFFLFFC